MPKSVFTEPYRILVQELINARKAAGLTQTQLAEKLGRPQPFVSYFERCERRVDVVEFIVIARAIGVAPEDLIVRIGKRFPKKFDI